MEFHDMSLTATRKFESFDQAFAAWSASATWGGAYHPTALAEMKPRSMGEAIGLVDKAYQLALARCAGDSGSCSSCPIVGRCYNPPARGVVEWAGGLRYESCAGTSTTLHKVPDGWLVVLHAQDRHDHPVYWAEQKIRRLPPPTELGDGFVLYVDANEYVSWGRLLIDHQEVAP